MATKRHGYGTQLLHDSDGSGAYTAATDLKSIVFPTLVVAQAKTTHLESTSAHDEYIPGYVEPGEAQCVFYWHQTQYNTFKGLLRTMYYWQVKFPLISGETNNGDVKFTGFISSLGIPQVSDEDGAIMYEMNIKVTGVQSFTAPN